MDYQEAEPKHLEQARLKKRIGGILHVIVIFCFFLNVFNIENYKEIYSYGDSTYIGPTYDMF